MYYPDPVPLWRGVVYAGPVTLAATRYADRGRLYWVLDVTRGGRLLETHSADRQAVEAMIREWRENYRELLRKPRGRRPHVPE